VEIDDANNKPPRQQRRARRRSAGNGEQPGATFPVAAGKPDGGPENGSNGLDALIDNRVSHDDWTALLASLAAGQEPQTPSAPAPDAQEPLPARNKATTTRRRGSSAGNPTSAASPKPDLSSPAANPATAATTAPRNTDAQTAEQEQEQDETDGDTDQTPV
jgi:hypothetical protein